MAGGIKASANMWALLDDNDPGDSEAAAGRPDGEEAKDKGPAAGDKQAASVVANGEPGSSGGGGGDAAKYGRNKDKKPRKKRNEKQKKPAAVANADEGEAAAAGGGGFFRGVLRTVAVMIIATIVMSYALPAGAAGPRV